jgi:hypothetical protein
VIIDSLLVALGFRVDKKGIEEFEKKAFDVKKAMTGIAEAVAVAGIGEWIGHAVERLSDVQKLSEVLQLPAKSIAALNKVAAENEVPLEGMQSTMETLSRTAGQAALGIGRGAMIFQKLGLHAKDAHGNVKGFNELLGDVADKLQGKSRTEQLGIAGRLGIDEHLLNILGQGRQKIEELTAAAEKANPLGNADYENALKTEKLFAKTKASVTAVSNQIAVKLLPVIDQALTAITAWFGEARNSDAFATFIKMVVSLAMEIGHVVGAVTSVVAAFAKWGPGAAAMKVAIATIIGLKLANWLKGVASAGLDAAKALVKTAGSVEGLKKALMSGLILFLALAIEDLWQFYNGGLSVTGMLVNKWAPALTLIKIGIAALSALWIASMVPVGVATAVGFLPLYLGIIAIGALILALYELKKHWVEVMDFISDKLNPIIDKVNAVADAFGLKGIEHIKSGSQTQADDQKKLIDDPNLQWGVVHPNMKKGEHVYDEGRGASQGTRRLPSGRMVTVFAGGMHTGAPPHVTEGSKHSTQIHNTTVTVQKVEIKTNSPEQMGKEFNRQVTRNAQSRTVL